MWYVMQVPVGQEQVLQRKCAQMLDYPVLEKSFLPYYDEMRKRNGEWTIVREILFPGYVFVVTDHPQELHQALKKVSGWKRLLTTGNEIVPLTPAEEAFLRHIGNEDQIVHASRGIIENGQIIITEGPLKGKEAYIRKIDRHKRLAYLELKMFSEVVHARVSLEIYAKNTQVRVPDAEKLLAEQKTEVEEKRIVPEPRREYENTLFVSDQAAVSLNEDQSTERIQELHRQLEQEQKGE